MQRKVTYRSILLAIAVAIVLPVTVNLASETVPREWAPVAWPVAIALAVVIVVLDSSGSAHRASPGWPEPASGPVPEASLDEIDDTQFSVSWSGRESLKSYMRYSNAETSFNIILMATLAALSLFWVLTYHWGDGFEPQGEWWGDNLIIFIGLIYGLCGPIAALGITFDAIGMRRKASNRGPWGVRVDAAGITTRDSVSGRHLYEWDQIESVQPAWVCASRFFQFDHEVIVITGVAGAYDRINREKLRPTGWHQDEVFSGEKLETNVVSIVAIGPLTPMLRAQLVVTLQRHGQHKWHSNHEEINIY